MADKQLQPHPTKGPSQAFPCCWCGKPGDLSQFGGQLDMLEPGAELECDHCHRFYQVQRVEQVTIVFARPINRPQHGFRR